MGQTVGHSPFDFVLTNLKEVQKKKWLNWDYKNLLNWHYLGALHLQLGADHH